MAEYEFRSRIIKESSDEYKYNQDYRNVEKTCDAWAEEGFIVFSIDPIPTKDYHDRLVVRLSAKRHRETATTPKMDFEDEIL